RNIIVVYPELPWSHGTDIKRENTGSSKVWNGVDSNLKQLHNDIVNIISIHYGKSPTITSLSFDGHSKGGAALEYAAIYPSEANNYFLQIKPTLITLSDADYAYGGRLVAQVIYENYLSKVNARMGLLVQDPSRTTAHSPTKNAILFVKEIGGESAQGWFAENTDWTTVKSEKYATPGAEANKEFKIPGHENIIYFPLTKDHYGIAKMSLAWVPGQVVS
ncbi:MAG: hypothetical protein V2A62_04535, partial [Candidatus Woesearchaeota archaeon]